MRASPSTHFVALAQSVLYRGAGLDVVWPQFLIIAVIGVIFLALAVLRFRQVTAQAA
jgi:ABC-2 type transport system permease protein